MTTQTEQLLKLDEPTISLVKPQSKGCENFLNSEKVRYKRKGYGLIVASLIALAFFHGVPNVLGKHLWPEFLKFKEDYQLSYATFFVGWSIIQHNLITLIGNLCYYIFYHYEFEFTERYKSNSRPWP